MRSGNRDGDIVHTSYTLPVHLTQHLRAHTHTHPSTTTTTNTTASSRISRRAVTHTSIPKHVQSPSLFLALSLSLAHSLSTSEASGANHHISFLSLALHSPYLHTVCHTSSTHTPLHHDLFHFSLCTFYTPVYYNNNTKNFFSIFPDPSSTFYSETTSTCSTIPPM